jgi:hypothetical protein
LSADLTLPARGPIRLAAVAVSRGWFQTAVTLISRAAPGGVAVSSFAPLSEAQRAAVGRSG